MGFGYKTLRTWRRKRLGVSKIPYDFNFDSSGGDTPMPPDPVPSNAIRYFDDSVQSDPLFYFDDSVQSSNYILYFDN